jgi:hypothetical protein
MTFPPFKNAVINIHGMMFAVLNSLSQTHDQGRSLYLKSEVKKLIGAGDLFPALLELPRGHISS